MKNICNLQIKKYMNPAQSWNFDLNNIFEIQWGNSPDLTIFIRGN